MRFVAGVALALVLPVASDMGQPAIELLAAARRHAAYFRGCGPVVPVHQQRPLEPECRIEIDGLAADAEVAVDLQPGSRGEAEADPAIVVGGRSLAWSQVRTEGLIARANPRGQVVLRVRFGEQGRRPTIESLRAQGQAWAWPPWRRLRLYLLLAVLAGWCGARAQAARPFLPGTPAPSVSAFETWTLALVSVGLALGLWFDRLATLAILPGLGLALALALTCLVLAAWLEVEVPTRRWLAALAAFKLMLVVQPTFPSIDVGFHSGTLVDFMHGDLIVSRAPNPDTHAGALPVPYPPAVYALLAPLAALGWPRELLVRALLGVLEGLVPLAVVALARGLGLAAPAASAAGLVAALLPEGLLVLAKGIVANSLANLAGLAALAAATRQRLVLATALLSLTLLAHFGHSLLLAPLWFAWAVWPRPASDDSNDSRWRRLAPLAVASAVAVLTYYGSVLGLAVATAGEVQTAMASRASLGVRLVLLGKVVQDLLLKFGAWPLVLAAWGWGHRPTSGAGGALLPAFVLVTFAALLGALFTPVPLRFELFACPLVALLAGLGVERLGASRRVALGWWALAALQLAMAALLLAGRFRLISVILESNRWPFPLGF